MATAALRLDKVSHSLPSLLLAGLGIGLGAITVYDPMLALASTAAIVGVPLLVASPMVRLIFITFGGMAVLGSSSELSVAKIAYLAGAIIAIGAIVMRLPVIRRSSAYTGLERLLQVSLVFGVFLSFEMFWSLARGTALTLAIRDVAPYLFFALIPLLALDVHTSSASRWLAPLFFLAGGVATLAFAVEWIGRRGFGDLPISHLALSGALPAGLFSYAAAGALLGRRRAVWIIVAGATFSLMVMTGNRSILLLVGAPAAILFFARGNRLPGLLRLVVLGVSSITIGFLAVAYLGTIVGLSPDTVFGRFETLLNPSALVSDQTYVIRFAQTQAAAAQIEAHTLLGTGPGHIFEWIHPLTETRIAAAFTLDSPLAFPAKFGIVGVALLLILVFTFGSLLVRLSRHPTLPRWGLIGFSATQVAAMLLLGAPLEDKGFSIGLLFLLAMSLDRRGDHEARGAATEPVLAKTPRALQKTDIC